MADDSTSISSPETIRRFSKHQAKSSREGGLFLNNQDRIKLSHASLENTMLANRTEAKNADSENPKEPPMNDQLFNQQHPAPTGKMPGQPEFNEETPSEDEQNQYEQFVTKAVSFMGKNAGQLVATMNDKDKPVYESVGALTVKVGKMVLGSAKAAGAEISPDIIHASGEEIVEHLMEMGDAAGIFPFDSDSEEYEMAMNMSFLHAAEIVGNETLQSPEYTPELKEEAGDFYAQQVAGEVQRGEVPEGFHDDIANNKAAGMQQAMKGG